MSSLWIKVQTTIVDNPKIIGLSDSAFRAFIEMMIYSQQHLSDGFIDERVARSKWGDQVLDELMTNDKNNPSVVAVEDGFQLYNYCKYQTTAAKVEEIRERAKKAGKKSAANRAKTQLSVEQPVEHNVEHGVEPETEVEEETEEETESSGAKFKETRLPSNWMPNKQHLDIAKKLNVDVMREAEMFRLHAQAHDRHAKVWNAAFTMWLKKAKPNLSKPAIDPDWWMYPQESVSV
jgi:hypothetical protein